MVAVAAASCGNDTEVPPAQRLLARLASTEQTFEATLVQLADQDVLADQNRYREVSTRHAELKPIVDAYRLYLATQQEVAEAKELKCVLGSGERVVRRGRLLEKSEPAESTPRTQLPPRDPEQEFVFPQLLTTRRKACRLPQSVGGAESQLTQAAEWTLEPDLLRGQEVIDQGDIESDGLKRRVQAVAAGGEHRCPKIPSPLISTNTGL